jgi:aerobic-type carbon monoxide dehydrogenase small subunit (CoxS/CutS family)
MAAAHLLERHPDPGVEDIKEALAGNICRCTGYGSIVRALAGLAGHEEPA